MCANCFDPNQPYDSNRDDSAPGSLQAPLPVHEPSGVPMSLSLIEKLLIVTVPVLTVLMILQAAAATPAPAPLTHADRMYAAEMSRLGYPVPDADLPARAAAARERCSRFESGAGLTAVITSEDRSPALLDADVFGADIAASIVAYCPTVRDRVQGQAEAMPV